MAVDLFNEAWYLRQHPDVAEAVRLGLITARDHFESFGKFEGRSPSPSFNTEHYLAQNPDVKAAVDAGIISAYDHFTHHGSAEGRSFVPYFDADFYLSQNPDIAAAVEQGPITATEHFLLYGQGEPRAVSPFFDLGAYLRANPDVQAAVDSGAISALDHLMTYGFTESRDLGNGVNLGQFADDPKFQEAIAEGGNPFDALARVAEVAPFLPSFEPPAGWEPPADTPIPVDFVPVEGEKLVIPPSVEVPVDVELPEDVFEPSEPTPEEPGDTGPAPGPKDPDEPDDPDSPALDWLRNADGELVAGELTDAAQSDGNMLKNKGNPANEFLIGRLMLDEGSDSYLELGLGAQIAWSGPALKIEDINIVDSENVLSARVSPGAHNPEGNYPVFKFSVALEIDESAGMNLGTFLTEENYSLVLDVTTGEDTISLLAAPVDRDEYIYEVDDHEVDDRPSGTGALIWKFAGNYKDHKGRDPILTDDGGNEFVSQNIQAPGWYVPPVEPGKNALFQDPWVPNAEDVSIVRLSLYDGDLEIGDGGTLSRDGVSLIGAIELSFEFYAV